MLRKKLQLSWLPSGCVKEVELTGSHARKREKERYLESIGMFLVTRYLLSPASVRAIITFAFVQDFC